MSAPLRRRRAPLLALALALVAAPLPAQRIREVQVAPRFLRMRQDAQTQLSATAYDQNGTPLDVPFHWRSSNINVVSVDSTGMVRALAPGNALVMAWAEEGGRQRVGRVAVQVMREGEQPGFPGMPPGGMPPMMPPPVPPGVPPGGRPPGMPDFISVDSSVRASINCAEPMLNAINPLRACWDTRAAPADSSDPEFDRPGPDKCPFHPSPVGLFVRISETGEVSDVRLYSPSNCQEMNDRAMARARQLRFTPATRAGKPIASWRVLRMRGRQSPP